MVMRKIPFSGFHWPPFLGVVRAEQWHVMLWCYASSVM